MSALAMPPPPALALGAQKPLLAIVNETTVLADADVTAAIAACQKQVSNDLAPEWGTDAELAFFGKGEKVPPTAWLVALLDNADQAGALGYHDLTARGLPLAKVFVKTTMSDGGLWTVTLSHEIPEMLIDPAINRTASDERRGRLRFYALEGCDAVEADELGYDIDGVRVSDVVTQDWFNPNVVHTRATSLRKHVKGAFSLAAGGYIGYLDADSSSGWQQLTAKNDEAAKRASRAHPGSRRERRRVGRGHWRLSTAHAEAHVEG